MAECWTCVPYGLRPLELDGEEVDFLSNVPPVFADGHSPLAVCFAGTVVVMTTPLVLLVDDNEGNRDLMALHLDGLPIRCELVPDGQGALEAIAKDRPDLILLDVMMPKMSGFEVCRAIKTDEALREIPVVMVTALDSVVDQDRAKAEGADAYMVKPIDREELREEVCSRLNLPA